MVLSADGRREQPDMVKGTREKEGTISHTAALMQVADLSTHQSIRKHRTPRDTRDRSLDV